VTAIEKGASAAVAMPLLTVITISGKWPPLFPGGVPVSAPVAMLNSAHPGRLEIEKASGLPSGSRAEGVKLYVEPAVAVVAGDPAMVGAGSGAGWAGSGEGRAGSGGGVSAGNAGGFGEAGSA
jgi:hypothetical protein